MSKITLSELILQAVDRNAHTPLSWQVHDVVRQQILAGDIAAGTRLPSTRSLAAGTGLSRNTILVAYEQLLCEGYVVSVSGSGTYASEIASPPRPEPSGGMGSEPGFDITNPSSVKEATMAAAVPQSAAGLAAARDVNVSRGVVTAHPVFVSHARGSRVWAVDGREYLDFVGGIGVMNVGHNNPAVVGAVQKQLERLTHMAFQVGGYDVYIELAQRLNRIIGAGRDYKSVFLTTGAEAVENAVKIARSYRDAPGIIAFRGGFHGRTLLGMTLTGMSEPYKQNFGPFAGDVYHTPYPDDYRGIDGKTALRELENLLATTVPAHRVAAVLIEPVQGDGGFLYAGDDFLRKLRALTEKHGILLICDEIQSGFGRAGTLFGFQHSGIQPDLVTVAKSLAAGLPLSGVIGRAEVMDAPTPGGLGGTYGGNPLACAAALAVLDLFETTDLLNQAARLGEQLRKGLEELARKYSEIGMVRGLGAMVALEFVQNNDPFAPDIDLSQRVVEQARELGLLIIKCGFYRNTVRLLAPLTTTADEATRALAILDQAIERARQGAS